MEICELLWSLPPPVAGAYLLCHRLTHLLCCTVLCCNIWVIQKIHVWTRHRFRRKLSNCTRWCIRSVCFCDLNTCAAWIHFQRVALVGWLQKQFRNPQPRHRLLTSVKMCVRKKTPSGHANQVHLLVWVIIFSALDRKGCYPREVSTRWELCFESASIP